MMAVDQSNNLHQDIEPLMVRRIACGIRIDFPCILARATDMTVLHRIHCKQPFPKFSQV